MSIAITSLTAFLAIIVGLITGILSGLMGVGGGVILVPMLLRVFSIEPHKAIGISLAVIVPTALVGAYRHGLQIDSHLSIAVLLSIGGIAGAIIGAALCNALPVNIIKQLFGILLVLVGISMIFENSKTFFQTYNARAKNTSTNSDGSDMNSSH